MQPSYRDALAWLYGRRRGDAERDPARMARLMAVLDLSGPEHMVHVVGTNGKGTVASMVDAGIRAWGKRSGRFVSPHVEDFRERVVIDGRAVSSDTVRRFVARAQALELVQAPAFFEWTLALALSVFRRAGAEWGVFEAGVGGARDATRALDPMALVVLTNVSLDHVDTLGPGLRDIARAKAGAIRAGVPVVTAARGEALEVVRREARRLGSPLHVAHAVDPLFAVPAGTAAAGVRADNARLAAAALRLLGASESAVATALRVPPLPGRGERFPMRRRDVLLDGAHDPAAAAALAATLEPGYVLLFGALRRKQGEATLAALESAAAGVVLTEAAAGEGAGVAATGRSFVADPGRALELALRRCPEGGTVVVAGSLYLAGRLRPLLRRRSRRSVGLAGPAGTPVGRP